MYDKKYFQSQLMNMLKPIEKYYNGGKVQFAKHGAWYENTSADMEAFARPLWGLVPYWAGGGEANGFAELYVNGLSEGANKKSKTYWGECHDRDQRFVEMASISYGLIFAKEILWDRLNKTAQDNLVKWLSSINDHEVCDSNWTFFRVLVNIALKKIGRPYSRERLTRDIARLDEFYVGNGWYTDGINGQTDYYIAFALHFYGLVYAMVMDDEQSKIYKERAMEFAKSFIYWFDEDGEALPYGRSLTYRFAQIAFWGACVAADIRPFPIEVMKGIIARNLDNWMNKEIFDNSGILTVGYDYPNLIMAEHYNAHGSPYWALKSYIFLMLDDKHEFWSCDTAPMPRLDEIKLIKEAKMLASRRGGKSVIYPDGNNTAFHCGQVVPKYLKFAYSAHFGFNVMKSAFNIAEAACDNMLAFEYDGMIFLRRHFKSSTIENDRFIIEWSPLEGIDVKTTVAVEKWGHSREHEITSEYDCIAYDTGFGVASRDEDNAQTKDGFIASVKNNFQHCEVLSETGGKGIVIPASPNTNLRYQKTLIPAMQYEIKKGKARVKTLIRDHMEE